MSGEFVGPRNGVLTISATSYKFSAQHNNFTLVFTSGSAIAFLIPVELVGGIKAKIIRVGAGLITFSTEDGVSLHNLGSQTTSGNQYAVLYLEAIGTDNYVLSGDVPGSGGASLSVTDGTHTVAGTTSLTLSGATVSGSTPNATATISGGSSTGPAGTVQMADGSGGFAASSYSDVSTPGGVTAVLSDLALASINGSPGWTLTAGGVSLQFAPEHGQIAGSGDLILSALTGVLQLVGAGSVAVVELNTNGLVAVTNSLSVGNPAGATLSRGDLNFSGTGKVNGVPFTGSGAPTTAVAGAATLDAPNGVITTESLTAATSYTLTLTNSVVLSTSTVIAIASNSSGAVPPPTVTSITESSGSVVIVFAMAALTGTFEIRFAVFN